MVRETRHLWVGNLPDNIREERIREHFKRYGRVQSVKLLPRSTKEETVEGAMACTVAFMDIKSASKAHNTEHKVDDRTLTTEYYEPAAIPSAASPQTTTSPYSTSPGNTRFPNGHSSTEEHAAFGERFYDRTNNRAVADDQFIRRGGYHETNRGRNRERGFRNGPYNVIIDRGSHRTLNNAWSYDSGGGSGGGCAGTGGRYNSQNETGYTTTSTAAVATPADSGVSGGGGSERRGTSDQSTKKKTKSRSGSRSPSPSGSASSRSPSRSRSRSSSSSTSSSTSRTSSTSSPKSRRTAANSHLAHSDDRRPLAICVKNLPLRSSDTSLKDGLYHEYKKHGKVTSVKVVGQNSERHAIVCFKKPEDVEKALEVSYDKLFFGCKIDVASYQGFDVDDNDLRPYEAEIDEYHPKATRTLFIGNLEKDVTASDLRKHFDQFGEIIEIDIKNQGNVSLYAFCQYSDIVSVVKAIRKMDGEHLGNNRIKLGFGKSMPTNVVWADGVVENVNEKYLRMQFDPFGPISKISIDRERGQALIFYDQMVGAQSAVSKMRGYSLKGNKIQVDFASRECQQSFYEHLEKQAPPAVIERTEERRDSTSRSFDPTRFARYDTPTRPRTSSYSSRSSITASQVTSAIPSPGTPGSVTPRCAGSKSRIGRFNEYYEGAEVTDRHFRSYDEYSQGSAASQDDPYDPDYGYNNHDSPSHFEILESRSIQSVCAAEHGTVPYGPPDIRNLQKERVHLLEQLEDCPSSGDEHMTSKKRLKIDLLDAAIGTDVIIEANRDHRKVMEVRRLSDVSLKHHSRRPSIDSSKHTRDIPHERSTYIPHSICKRRKTGGSDSGSRGHHYDNSGSESVGGSRPGTPLCDERPENFPPSEPRRVPRDRDGPLTLPLPKFASQVMGRGSVSVAGIKGQKDCIISSPPPAVTSPRITNPKPSSPVHVPPPASPPPRPPSLSSNSSDSDNPPSPSLDERIKSLDELYEKWSGSRALSAAGGDALAKLDATREKFRLSYKLLDFDVKEVQPSEIVKSVMAKRSVFDEDLKRLENVGEKYEPKEFCLFPSSTTVTSPLTTVAISSPSSQMPKTPTMLSPRSTGSSMIPAKGLQYPFPSHPPVQPATTVPPQTPPTVASPTPQIQTTSTTTRSTTAGDIRLKPCASVSSDNRISSKVNVNKSVVLNNLNPPVKPCEKTAISETCAAVTPTVEMKIPRTVDKCKRDEVKSRRNSDVGPRRTEETEKFGDSSVDNDKKSERAKSEERKKDQAQRIENERLERERLEKEQQEKERLEKERLEREKQEREKELEKEREKKREEQERREKEERERKEKEEAEKKEREAKKEAEKLEKDRRKERENHVNNEHKHSRQSSKEEKDRAIHEIFKRTDSSQHNNFKHSDKESEVRRKESIKENRDNNTHEKHEKHKETELDRSKSDPNKRKENYLPAMIGAKRRMSSQEVFENLDNPNKKPKLHSEHKKITDRRDSKDSDRSKCKIKNNSRSSEDKSSFNRDSEDKRKDRDDKHRNKQKFEKQKSKSKRDSPTTVTSKELTDKDFLAKLDLRSNEELERQKKDTKEKRKQEISDSDAEKRNEDRNRREFSTTRSSEEKNKSQKKERSRKMTLNSSDNNTDSDEPRKHSIFDIVDDEPAYISMYDKVKARSCKNMQKQEEEKRQEKIKAKFSQLKQSRAKREEKKRSTSWDEDSDSDRERQDKNDAKNRRNKMLIASSDDDFSDVGKSNRKKDIFTDSDSDRHRQVKIENIEGSDEEIKHKSHDVSEDDLKVFKTVKLEIFSDNELERSSDHELKSFKLKDDIRRTIKKERKSSKQEDSFELDSKPPLTEIKTEKSNNRHSFIDSSADECNEFKKEKTKKHKKKQKRLKHSISSEDSLRFESVDSSLNESVDKGKHHDKKRQHSKKDKKRDKSKERDRLKKSKRSKSASKNDFKHDGKMENIFGSFSDSSENGLRDSENIEKINNAFLENFNDENIPSRFSDSDVEKIPKIEEIDAKEIHRKRKERRRKEKERRLQEAAAAAALAEAADHFNENSMDFADMGKQLEANIKDEPTDNELRSETNAETDDIFNYFDNTVYHQDYRKDCREKKKKRKRSKEERQKHHHHHDKNKIKKEIPALPPPLPPPPPPPPPQPKEEPENKPQSQSLPNILDMSSPPQEKTPVTTPESSLVKERSNTPPVIPDKFIARFDETIHENAVKSISEFDETKTDEVQVEETAEEKPRVVISQEETEDAVAALLGESFSNEFEKRYDEDAISATNDQAGSLVEEPQDDEEMRQAVQSLGGGSDIEVKPETPQSEHELQIDTDTEEQDDSSPKTPEAPELLPTKPTFFRSEEIKPIIIKPTASIGSPPSLAPITPQPSIIAAVKRIPPTEIPSQIPPLALPALIEPARTVITHPWASKSDENKPESTLGAKSSPNPPIRTYPPVIKLPETYPPLAAISKQEDALPVIQVATTTQHNLPARPPPSSLDAATKFSNIRLPVTSVVVSKPLQATPVTLPQAKMAFSSEPPKLIPTQDPRPRMLFQNAPPFPKMVQVPVARGLLVSSVRPGHFNYIPTSEKPSEIPKVIQMAPQSIIISPNSHLVNNQKVISHTPPSLVAISTPAIEASPKLIPVEKEIKQEVEVPKEEVKPSEVPPVIKEVEEEVEPKQLAIEKVTEELNESLQKEIDSKLEQSKEEPEKIEAVEDVKVEINEVEEKPDCEPSNADVQDLLLDAKEDKEDSDYWSSKDVNIDSVIKTLCSADELSNHSNENLSIKEETPTDTPIEDPKPKSEEVEAEPQPEPQQDAKELETSKSDDHEEPEDKDIASRVGTRRGGRGRGRKTRGGIERGGIQTRRGKVLSKEPVTPTKRGGSARGARTKLERKTTKSESEIPTTDIYEFREDEENRPRLILTIKQSNSQSAVVKEVPKELIPPPKIAEPKENKEEVTTPPANAANTRKSRRLQEKDISRTTVDDTIEDVVKNAVVTRSNATRRSARQPVTPVKTESPRKSLRGRKISRRGSEEVPDDKDKIKSDESVTVENSESPVVAEKEQPKPQQPQVVAKENVVEKPAIGLKAAVLRRVKGEMGQEPMTLIDPVTGLLIPMRECEENKYIPVPGEKKPITGETPVSVVVAEKPAQQSVITSQQPTATTAAIPVKSQSKPQSLKAHVLSSQAAQALVTHQVPTVQKQNAVIVNATPSPPVENKVATVPMNQNLNVNVSTPSYAPAHLSPRTKPPMTSPNQMYNLIASQHKQLQIKSSPPAIIPKGIVVSTAPMIIKHQQPIISKLPVSKTLHHSSSALGKTTTQPVASGGSRMLQGKNVMEPPKVDVSLSNLMSVRGLSSLSPQGQPTRHMAQSGVPVPGYEASLAEAIPHFPPGSVALRPPHDLPPPHYMHPSHVMYQQYFRQSYHFPRSSVLPGGIEKPGDGQEGEEAPTTSPPLELRIPGGVGLPLPGRGAAVPHSLQSPHDRATDSPQIGQVYNMQSARMQHYNPSRYYESPAEPPPAHRPVTSHSSLAALGSDRPPLSHMTSLGAPDRPLGSHLPPDRPLGSHLPPDRPLGPHLPPDRPPMSGHSVLTGHLPMGNPERPSSSHLPPDRPLSSHLTPSGHSTPDRPISAHGMTLGAGLGAAGNLMGAVARHIGVDAPTSQRGLQAATPPHASQVPPQAESLFMLLKQYPRMWQGLLALKNDQAAVQMYFVSGNDDVAKCSLPKNTDGSTPPLRIFQRMRLEPPQVEGVARKMQMEKEHCMLLALPCGHDHMDVLKQSTNLTNGFITYLQQKQAAGIVNVAAPGTTQPPAYVVHIFPSCNFVNDNLRRIAPSLLERVADIAHLLIVITTV